MMRMRAVASCLVLMVTMTGCLSVKSYIDPQLPKVGYGDLLARCDPTVTKTVRGVAENSNVFSSLLDKPKDGVDQLEIVLDNVGDVGDAAGKGALTGLTLAPRARK